jgi:hypothetical protein
MSYESLKVTAFLNNPVILDRNQPLDGILSAAIIESPVLRKKYFNEVRRFKRNVEKYGRADAEAFWREKGWEIPQEHFLPLAVWGHGGDHGLWVYCSSWALYDEQARGIVHFNHHFDAELAERVLASPARSRKIQTGKGEFKSEHIPFQYRVMEMMTWFVEGDAGAIREVLAGVRAIAKKRNRGFGSVRRWTVEPLDEACAVFTLQGILMRPVPVDLLNRLNVVGEFEYAFTTYRPPYWDGRYVARCAVAGTAVDIV